MTLGKKTLFLLLATVLPSLFVAALALRTSLNFMESAALDTVSVQTTVARQDVEAWLDREGHLVENAALDPSIVDRLDNARQPIDPGRLGLLSVSILDSELNTVFRTDDAPSPPTALLDAYENKLQFGPARRVARGDDRVLVLAPIIGAQSSDGVLAAEISLAGLAEVLPVDTPWTSGEILVVQPDADRLLAPITPLRFVDDAEFTNIQVIKGLSSDADKTLVGRDYRENGTVAGVEAIDNSTWSIVVKADDGDVLVAPERVRFLWFIALIGATAWTAALVFLFYRRYQQRLQALTLAADRLADRTSYDPIPVGGSDELGQLTAAIDRVRVATIDENRRREEIESELRHQVNHDMLTGQLNRTRFMELLDQAIATFGSQRCAVLFCDLDNFKSINDRFGHNVGDELLSAIGDRLARQTKAGELLARYGGDEFVFFTINDGDRPAQLREELERSLHDAVQIDETFVTVEGSIGLARGIRGEDAAGLVRRADLDMYEVKRIRKGAMLPTGDRRRVDHEDEELSIAIEENELRLLYQPIIALDTGAIRGVEGLVRWRHPEFGLLDPTGIITRADRGGLLDKVDSWVFETACRQLEAWMRTATVDDSFTMSVNLSPPLLTDSRFVDHIGRTLETYDVKPSMLQVEITEQGLGGVSDQVNKSLADIKALGLKIAIDDFGTLHSNLDRLREFPADTLKIDKSFVSGADRSSETQAILSAILAVAKALGVMTVAEGIETLPERTLLADLGCSFGQGFFFGPPRTAEATAQLLSWSQHQPSWLE
ncbi:MAG: bifunctional diguanylate cyclase/phosphodiesterase [Acidimicrobiales bacterium]